MKNARVSTGIQERDLQTGSLKCAKRVRVSEEKASGANAEQPPLVRLLAVARWTYMRGVFGLPGIAFWMGCVLALGQQTHVVRVNADGTFSPQSVYIKSGDTVRWEQLTRTDSVIPAAGPDTYPGICGTRKPYNPDDPNEFTGPLPFAPPGVFTLSPLEEGYVEATGACPGGAPIVARGDDGKVLCPGTEYEATMNATWQSDQVAGVFIRLLWRDVHTAADRWDFSVLQREVERAVKHGKVYSLGIKAGDDGTPDWIFSTNADGSPRPNGGGGVPRLSFRDPGDGLVTNCGNRLDLGNPARATYRQLYFAMLTEVAKVLKSRADWYRALAYIKISGANVITHENRLPNECRTILTTRCPCSPATFAADGYRPSGLQTFYDEQTRLLRDLFPGKPMSYALIQDGFPRVNESGGYMDYDGNSSNNQPLPGAFEQTQSALDRGQQRFGLNFVVQHNGLSPKPQGCNFDGFHPKPVRALDGYWEVGSGCPNRWAVREGAEGQITGFQTSNRRGVGTPAELGQAFQNLWDNTDGAFLEIYEDVFWESVHTNRGVLPGTTRTIGAWNEDLHRRRNETTYPNFVTAGNPFPGTYSKRFAKTTQGSEPQVLYYVHGMKCGLGRGEYGSIIIDAQPPAIKAGGVVSATAFGGSPAVAPGTWIEIYGSGLAALSRAWAGNDFNGVNAPTNLGGTSVQVAGQSAFVAYVSPGQVNAQVPSNVPSGTQPVTVATSVGSSAAYNVTVAAVQPGLLAPAAFNAGGRQYAGALFPDGVTYVLPAAVPGVVSRRARPGDTIILYGIGFGPVAPNIPAGQTVQTANALASQLQVFFGSARATLSYAGLAPLFVGLYQFNVVVPNIAAGDAIPLTFTLGGAPGAQVLYTAVQN